ncbi:MAG: PDZ domain-containing protein, partial [Sphingobium sp.]
LFRSGVTLKAVLFDHVVIDRGGVEETLFLDQSQPVAPVTPSAASEAEAAPNPSLSAAGAIEMLKAGIGLAPRLANGRITGLVVSSKGPGFAAAGFREGDIITKIGDRPVGSAGDLSALQQMLVPGARIGLTVERGASEVPIAILVPAQ